MHVFQPENRFMYEKQENFLSTAKSGIFNYDNSEKDKQKKKMHGRKQANLSIV